MKKRLWVKTPAIYVKKIPRNIAKPITGFIVITLTSIWLLLFSLRSFTPFLPEESPENLGSANAASIKDNVVFGPIKVLQLALLKFFDDDALTRLASVAISLSAAILLYFILKKWFSTRITLLTMALFICSSSFLHLGRSTNTEVMYLFAFPAIMYSALLVLSKNSSLSFPLAVLLTSLSLYVPGSWALILAGVILFRKQLLQRVKNLNFKSRVISGAILSAVLTPMIYSFYNGQKQILQILGINTSETLSFSSILANFIDIPGRLFLYGKEESYYWLTGTPLLDVFSISMIGLGIYAFYAGQYPAREKIVYGSLTISVLLIGVGGLATVTLLLPLLYIIIANGLAYMLQSWFTVFPRNPVARICGVFILSIVVSIACFYHLQRYFIAWPVAETTQSAVQSTV